MCTDETANNIVINHRFFFNAQEVIREKDGTVIIMTHCERKYARDTLAYLKEFEELKIDILGNLSPYC